MIRSAQLIDRTTAGSAALAMPQGNSPCAHWCQDVSRLSWSVDHAKTQSLISDRTTPRAASRTAEPAFLTLLTMASNADALHHHHRHQSALRERCGSRLPNAASLPTDGKCGHTVPWRTRKVPKEIITSSRLLSGEDFEHCCTYVADITP